MKFESLVKKGTKAVVLTGVLVMVATGVQYKGDLISGLNDKLNTLESMLGTYSSRYQKDKSTIESLNGSKSDLEGQLKVANGKVTKYETDLTDVAGKLGITMDDTMGFDTDTKYEALKTAINNKIEANEGELEDVATILGCAEGDDISNAVQDLFNYYEEAQAEVTRLEGQLETANNVATNLQGELKKANDEIARLEGIISKYEGDLGSASTKAQGIIDGKQTEINEIKNSSDVATCESCGAKYSGTEHTCNPEKKQAYKKLSANAKIFANRGYVNGDLRYYSSEGWCIPNKKAITDKYEGLITLKKSVNRYVLNNPLTDDDITNLNAWAKL